MTKFSSKEEFLAYVQEQRIAQLELRKKEHDELWNNLPKFTDIKDVPELPVVDQELWDSFYVPKLIEAGAIQKKDLKDGHYYLGDHRRGRVAKWVASENQFHYWRVKFNLCFIDKCQHFEDFTRFSVFVPIKEVSEKEFNLTNENNGSNNNSEWERRDT